MASTPSTDTAAPTGAAAVRLSPAADEAMRLFAREIRDYLDRLPELLREGQAGRTVLIRGDHFSVWDTQGDALQAGHTLFGLESFFVRTIHPRDPERYAVLLQGVGGC
jgi:hypothetical protein